MTQPWSFCTELFSLPRPSVLMSLVEQEKGKPRLLILNAQNWESQDNETLRDVLKILWS